MSAKPIKIAKLGKRCTLLHGDALGAMPSLDAASVDSIITDPPYGLRFMGKEWDDEIIGADFWREALRVAKPGAHLLAFGGTRTFHRLACAIEDAGWEIRDCVMWLYGCGFPKSHDVSKAIDRMAGAKRDVVGMGRNHNFDPNEVCGYFGGLGNEWRITAPATADAHKWDGWGTALKPAWEPILVCRAPLSEGTVAANVLLHGTGAINVDAGRVMAEPWHRVGARNDIRGGGFNSGSGKKIVIGDGVAESNPLGRWPANVIHDGSDEALAGFPTSKRIEKNTQKINRHGKSTRGIYGDYGDRLIVTPCYPGGGSAARYFYCAKASKADRHEGCDGPVAVSGIGALRDGKRITERRRNTHPTVKPTALMAYLCKLVTPPGGTILDPLMGSGSTGKAAIQSGFEFIGIEINPEYMRIAHARLSNAVRQGARKGKP